MANSLPYLCILATCIVLTCAMPKGSLDLQDNYAKMKSVEADHEHYLFDVGFDDGDQGITSECDQQQNETDPGFPYPLHASCRVEWTFGVDCEEVARRLENQIALWVGRGNCPDGGQKCLYKLRSLNKWLLRGQHATPIMLYVDNLGFRFRPTTYGCYSKAYSYSTVPYALLDYGTNYCNIFNLVDGSGLNKEPNFTEKTCNKICTEFTDRDCEVY